MSESKSVKKTNLIIQQGYFLRWVKISIWTIPILQIFASGLDHSAIYQSNNRSLSTRNSGGHQSARSKWSQVAVSCKLPLIRTLCPQYFWDRQLYLSQKCQFLKEWVWKCISKRSLKRSKPFTGDRKMTISCVILKPIRRLYHHWN